VDLSVEVLLWVQRLFARAANCAAPPTASAVQYATSNCKSLLFRFPCKCRYINVGTFNLLFVRYCLVLVFVSRSHSLNLMSNGRCMLLARDSIYAIARYMLSPVRLSVCPSVCPSVRHTGGSVKDG